MADTQDRIPKAAIEAALRNEFADWIAGHPRAGLFDWSVAAQNVRERLCQELATALMAEPNKAHNRSPLLRLGYYDAIDFVESFGKADTDG